MIALYGTQVRYAPDVLAYGIQRDSAAFFLLPDIPERETTRRTLACAVYHALGLSLLREAVQYGHTLRTLLEKAAGGISLIYMYGVTVRDWTTSRYILANGVTYPYVKLRDSGPVDTHEKHLVCLEPCVFDARIDGAENETGYRFFQKLDGENQWITGCDMRVLEGVCMYAAEQSLRMFAEFLFGKDGCDENP